MIVKTRSFLIPAILTAAVIAFYSCENKGGTTDPNLDAMLFTEMTTTAGHTYYSGGNVLAPASPSPHGSFKLRFNPTAASALDGTGELPAGGTFPAGSMLVKEVQTGGNLSLYAVIKKDPTSPNAASGWVWAEFNLNGTAVYSTTGKGANCVSCHSESPNRDRTRTFDLH